jgi:hypothetical protein
VAQAYAPDSCAIRDLEEPSLPSDVPEIEDVRTLLVSEDPEIDEPKDIAKIIETCLKDLKPLKQHNLIHTIKLIQHLTAVSEYVNLRASYRSSKVCKQPCLKASIAIAR